MVAQARSIITASDDTQLNNVAQVHPDPAVGIEGDARRQVVRLQLDQLFSCQGATQPRGGINPATVQAYADDYAQNADFPPLKVIQAGADFLLYDGFHRAAAQRLWIERASDPNYEMEEDSRLRALEVSRRGTFCDVMRGDLDKAIWLSLSENAKHGLRRSVEDYPRIVQRCLKHPYAREMSFVQLAKHCKMAPQTFTRHWKTLSANGVVDPPPEKMTVMRNGKPYEMGRKGSRPQPEMFSPPPVELDQLDQSVQVTLTLPLPVADAQVTSSDPQTPIVFRPSDYVSPEARVRQVMTSSKTCEHYTPGFLLGLIYAVLGGVCLDPCSNARGEKANVRSTFQYTSEDDGLARSWMPSAFGLKNEDYCGADGLIWTTYSNHPFSVPALDGDGEPIIEHGVIKMVTQNEAWIDKALKEHEAMKKLGIDHRHIMLTRGDTSTKWCQKLAGLYRCEIAGRLTFIGNDNAATFPVHLYYMGAEAKIFVDVCRVAGSVRPPAIR